MSECHKMHLRLVELLLHTERYLDEVSLSSRSTEHTEYRSDHRDARWIWSHSQPKELTGTLDSNTNPVEVMVERLGRSAQYQRIPGSSPSGTRSLLISKCSPVRLDWFIKGGVVCGLPVIRPPKRSLGIIRKE
jgi:hypothetical protein